MPPKQRPFTWKAYVKMIGDRPNVTSREVFRLLGQVQDAFGAVPRSVVTDLARRSTLSEARLYGALTAYPGFRLLPES
ncbi:MAG: hypothetical protein HY343_03910 [Lentisphaerae bacterium]|nr:hypothetical protein [Lentisphaerota bacterium]